MAKKGGIKKKKCKKVCYDEPEVKYSPVKKSKSSGLARAAVGKQLKVGAESTIRFRPSASYVDAAGVTKQKKVRVTKEAVSEAVKNTEFMLVELARECQHMLDITKKMTVTKECLLNCLRSSHHFAGSEDVVKSAINPQNRKGTKGAREAIAIASAVKIFRKGISKDKRIAGDAKYAISALALAYIRHIGARSGDFANAGNRGTIKSTDVASAVKCVG
jgi:histone H3/H4